MKKKNGIGMITLILSICLCVSPCAQIMQVGECDVSRVLAMTKDPYKFYWDKKLGNEGKGVIQEEANIYWCSRGNASQLSNTYMYDNVGWYVQIRSETGDEIVIYVDDDKTIYGAEKKVDGYYYTIQWLPNSAIFDAIYESAYNYNTFCDGTLTVEFDGNVKIHKDGAKTYGPYDLRSESELQSLLSKMTELSFTAASKTAVKEQFRNKIIKISGKTVLEKNTYKLDLDGKIDGSVTEDIDGYGTVDVYIDEKLVEEAVIEHSKGYLEEVSYRINNLIISEGYHNVGEVEFTGDLLEDTTVYVEIDSNIADMHYLANGGDIESKEYSKESDTELIVGKDCGTVLQQLKYGTNIETMTGDTLGLSKKGYTLSKWKGGDEAEYEIGTSYDASDFADEKGNTVKESHGGQVYMYAQWKVNQYKIEYDANGGYGEKMNVQEVLYDEEVQLMKNIYKKEGNKFIGWNTKKDGTGECYKDEEKVQGLTDEDGGSITLYATWDEAPKIEAHDIYVTNSEVERGGITEEYLMQFADATDKEDGILQKREHYFIGEDKETSFYVVDYQESDFQEIFNGEVSITYEAIDSVGNITNQISNVYIVDDVISVPDEERRQIRFISEEYKDTLEEGSIWNVDASYRNLLNNTLSNMQHKVDTEVEVESTWGYSTKNPGSGTFEKEPIKSWILDSVQLQAIQNSIINNGFSYSN